MQAEVSSNARLVKAIRVMGSGTLISRILGLVRLSLLAALLGSSTRKSDMFWTANLIPNSLLLLLAGGVLNTVLVPQITRAIKHDDDGGEAFVNRIVSAFGAAIAGLTIILTIAAPLITWVYTSNEWRDPSLAAHYDSMVALAYLCVPQLFFYGMFFLLGQVLNAKDEFGPMNWAPIANNVISIAVLGLYFAVWGMGDTSTPFTTGQIWLLGLGSTIGIVVQLVVMLPYMKRTGYSFKLRFDLKGSGLGRTVKIAKWTIFYVIASQLTLIVVTRLATSATAGGEGAGSFVYSSAEMLWLLPHSLITVSLATAMLSSASRLAAAHDYDGLAQETDKTVRFTVVLLVPASVGLIALATPAVALLFGHGQGTQGIGLIATTLIAFAIGLVPYTVQFIFNRTYYAMEETRTAFFLQLLILVLNMGLAVLFVVPWDAPDLVAPGLALAVTIAYTVGLVVTARALQKRLPSLAVRSLGVFIVRLFGAAIPAGVVAHYVAVLVIGWLGDGFFGNLVGAVAGIIAFMPIYLLIAKALHISEISQALARLMRRGGKPNIEEAQALAEVASLAPELGEPDAMIATREMAAVDPLIPPTSETEVADVSDELIDTMPRPAVSVDDGASMAPIVESGQMLNRRYSLQDRLLRRGDTETWLAFDQVLSRLVLVHLLPTDSPRVTHVLDAARKGAVATEARFLRVLDAVEGADSDLVIGGYVVCEYAPGQSLEELLTNGPLSALEAAWIVRELADALATMHTQGLFHERLSPETVLITASGNVKIVGFGIESALTPPTDGQVPWSQREAADVRALGKILYATLVQRWPGGDAWGLRAAPMGPQGEYLTPRQVRAGIAPALDTICDQVLSDSPRRSEVPLRTAHEIVRALNQVLGTADASSDLEHRLRYPTVTTQEASPTALPADDSTEALGVVFIETDEADLPPQPLSIKPPAVAANRTREKPRRRWLLVLIGVVVATLFISLAAMAFRDATKGDPTASPTEAASLTEVPITAGSDFDPEGDDTENGDSVANVFDGDAETSWETERYRDTPDLGGLKPGVGIVLDLGEVRSVAQVELMMTGEPTSLEILVPASDEPGAGYADWSEVATVTDGGAEIKATLSQPVSTQYILVWLTAVPQAADGRFVGEINEVTVFG